jgi:hypothetical protein
MPECRPQRGAFETWILCSGVEIGAFTGGAATGCGGPIRPNREKPNKYRYIPPAVVGMLEIAMRACQVSSESIRMSPFREPALARAALQNCRALGFTGRCYSLPRRGSRAASDVGAYRTLVTSVAGDARRVSCTGSERCAHQKSTSGDRAGAPRTLKVRNAGQHQTSDTRVGIFLGTMGCSRAPRLLSR